MTPYRNEEETLRARIKELETENAVRRCNEARWAADCKQWQKKDADKWRHERYWLGLLGLIGGGMLLIGAVGHLIRVPDGTSASLEGIWAALVVLFIAARAIWRSR